MTDNPIDMAIYVFDRLQEEPDEGIAVTAMQMHHALKTYRAEYISIKKSDVPDLSGLQMFLDRPVSMVFLNFEESAVLLDDDSLDKAKHIVKAAALVAQALEAEDEQTT